MPELSKHLLAELNAAITRRHLDSVAQEIYNNASECYAMITVGDDDYSDTGNTRFGGDPDLPEGMQWPVVPNIEQRTYCNFIGQINFAELPQLTFDTGLPSAGILYLFVRYMNSAAEPVVLDSIFFEGSTRSLARRKSPDQDELCDEYLVNLIPQRIRAVPAVSLAVFRKKFRNYIENNTADIDEEDGYLRFIDLIEDLRREGQIGQMLGFANASDERENLYRQIVLARLGRRELIYSDHWDTMEEYEAYIEKWKNDERMVNMYQSMRSDVEWLMSNRKQIAESVDQWKLLLRLESNPEMELLINDSDPLYVFVKEGDLARKCFSDLAGEVTQS